MYSPDEGIRKVGRNFNYRAKAMVSYGCIGASMSDPLKRTAMGRHGICS